MNLLFRLLGLLVCSIGRILAQKEKQNIFDLCQTSFRVWPTDLDVNLHMNNGVYLSIMDLGRVDLMLKSGVFWKLFLSGYYPVVKSESIRFFRSLEPLEKFQIHTQVESWDEHDFYIRQTFFRKDKAVAVGFIKGRFKKRGVKGSISTQNLFDYLQLDSSQKPKTALSLAQDKVESRLKLQAENWLPSQRDQNNSSE